ncbi:ABC transporter permease [Streptomyces sp. NPDC001698]|uniref:ABC transporter permease n=1 Tax=unclassified Streptomyces TaxID=2593676 RepID=UPI0036AFCEA3
MQTDAPKTPSPHAEATPSCKEAQARAGSTPAAAPPGRAQSAEDRRASGGAVDLFQRYAVLLVLVALVAVYSVLAPDTFPTMDTFRVITSTQAVLIVAVLGLTLPFAAGEFDLSFGAVIVWASTLTAVLTKQQEWPLAAAVPVVLVSCLLWGALNALFVVGFGISSMVTTLGSSTVIIGLTLAVSQSQVIAGPPELLANLTTGKLLGLPYPVWFSFAVAVVVWLVLEHTPLGRYLYFTGEGREVARLSGLPVDRLRTGALIASALFCGVAGMISFGRLGSADPNLGSSFLLPGAAAVFLGATVVRPGRFNAWGTVIAVYLLVTGVTGLQLLGGAGWLENVFNGGALVLAVTFAHVVARRRTRV